MDDLISRQAAIKLAMQYCPDDDGTYSKANEDIRNLLDDLENLPSAQSERQKGKWIWDGESQREYPYKCSECGEIDYYAFLYDDETREFKQQDNFCPNCGADMRGGAE